MANRNRNRKWYMSSGPQRRRMTSDAVVCVAGGTYFRYLFPYFAFPFTLMFFVVWQDVVQDCVVHHAFAVDRADPGLSGYGMTLILYFDTIISFQLYLYTNIRMRDAFEGINQSSDTRILLVCYGSSFSGLGRFVEPEISSSSSFKLQTWA